jgi:hypothetical protein
MRILVLLAGAVLTLIVVAACAARDDAGADSTSEDTIRDSGTVRDTLADSGDSFGGATKAAPASTPSASRREASPTRDTALTPDDSVRRTRPKLPEIVPDSKPGRWRGIRLPEKRPVTPIESVRAFEKVPDSIMKGDSTRPRPPRPDR